jgi:SAM-dependent methyltransferase
MDSGKTSAPGSSPRLYDALMWGFERAAIGGWRRRLARRANGRVLEVGAGTGSQFKWYSAGAQVVAVEPDAAMAARARLRAAAAIADGEFDSAAVSFTWCTVDDPERASEELRRVLKPDALLVMLEHVHLRWQPGRWLQSRGAPYWAAVAGGCRLDRDTAGVISAAGFEVLETRSHVLGWIVEIVARRRPGLPSAR